MLLDLFFIISVTNSMISTCWASPSDPAQVASALISMYDMEFVNDMENMFEGFIGNSNDLLYGQIAAGVEEEPIEEEDPKREKETIEEEEPIQEEEPKNEDEIINEEEQKVEEEPKKEDEQENKIENLAADSTPTNTTDDFTFEENYEVIKMVEDKDNDQECEDVCNDTQGCTMWTRDDKGNCKLYNDVPIPECTPPYKLNHRTCVYVAENETLTWEEAWARCKTMNGRLIEMAIHLSEPKRLLDFIEENHREIGTQGLWIGADTFDPPEWHWNTTGSPMDDDFPWGVGKPVGTYQQLWRECLQISGNAEGVFEYEDENCNDKHSYICEERPKVRKECYPPFVWMDGQCILFLEQRLTFHKAVERCRLIKGRLFQPNNPKIFKEYIVARYGTPQHPRGVWLGASLEKPRWVWTGSGRQVHHDFPWGRQKEDPTRREAEECMVIYANRGMPFTYDDTNCYTKAFYVCESQDCWPPYEKFGDQCLLVIEERRNWEDAQESCKMDYNGRLAEIREPLKFVKFMHDSHCKKRVFLKKAAKISCPPIVEYDPGDYQQEYWLGARAKKILWRWNSTGQVIPLDFPWGENEPSGSYNGNPEECLNLFSNGKYSWKYNDAHCSKRLFFTCELPDTSKPANLTVDTSKPANLTVGNTFLGMDADEEKYLQDEYGRAWWTKNEDGTFSNSSDASKDDDDVIMPEGAECKDNNDECYAWNNKGWCEFKEVKEQCWLSCKVCFLKPVH